MIIEYWININEVERETKWNEVLKLPIICPKVTEGWIKAPAMHYAPFDRNIGSRLELLLKLWRHYRITIGYTNESNLRNNEGTEKDNVSVNRLVRIRRDAGVKPWTGSRLNRLIKYSGTREIRERILPWNGIM